MISQGINNLNGGFEDQLGKQRLFLQVGLSSFQYNIYDVNSNQLLTTKQFEFERSYQPNTFEFLNAVRSLISEESILKSNFDEVTISHLNNQVTLVPNQFFNEQEISSYLRYATRIQEFNEPAFDTIEQASLTMVYVPFSNIQEYFKKLFPHSIHRHCASCLLKKILNNYHQISENEIFINFNLHSYEVIAFKAGKLLLYNQFDKKSPEDFTYHTLFVSEQLGFDLDILQLNFMGNINPTSEFYKIAFQFVTNVSMANLQNQY